MIFVNAIRKLGPTGRKRQKMEVKTFLSALSLIP